MENRKSLIRFFLIIVFFLFGVSANISAATFTVNQPDDAGDGICDASCTLRDAIIEANTSQDLDDIIVFAPFLTTITLNSEITIDQSDPLIINGPGANRLTIDGGPGTNRIFYTFTSQPFSSELIIRDVTLTGGGGGGLVANGNGGAIYANTSILKLIRVHITGNTAISGAGIFYNAVGLVVEDSTISNNTASAGCGGFDNRGDGLLVMNSTISGNIAAGDGGGFCHSNSGFIFFSTVTNNTAFRGGGLVNNFSATLHINNSIIAGNQRTGLIGMEIYISSFGNPGDVASDGYNLVGDDPGDSFETNIAITYQPTDILDTPPQIVPLGNYGGTTPTHPLQFNSAAKDAADAASGWDFDQRGFDRNMPDIGAFEVQDLRYYVTQAAAAPAGGSCDSNCSLQEALWLIGLAGGGTVDFARIFTSATPITLADSPAGVGGNITIAGYSAADVVISAAPGFPVFNINTGTVTGNVTLLDITVTRGDSFFGHGAIHVGGGSVTLQRVYASNNFTTGVVFIGGTNHRILNSTFSNNGPNNCGGAILSSGTVNIANSTFANNSVSPAFGSGGALCVSAGTANLHNVTITGNHALYGGGIFQSGGILNLANSIVAGNSSIGSNPPEIYFAGGTLTSAGNNLIGYSPGDAANTVLPILYQASDILDTPPMLDYLQMNGGTTPTMALLAGSPAIDAGDNLKAVDPLSNSPLLADQRGFLRFIGVPIPVVDIGAFEFGSATNWSANTPSGTNVNNQLGPVSVTFSDVSTDGGTYFTPIEPASAGTLPTGFSLGPGLPSFDISTTASFTPPITVCVQVPFIANPAIFAALKLLHGEKGVLVDRTVSRDFPSKTICASVDALSPFVVAQSLAPTAAEVDVGGRILTAEGHGISKAVIFITDALTGETRSAISNSFGYYRFNEVEAGKTYILNVNHKQHAFSPQIISVVQSVTDLNFTAEKQDGEISRASGGHKNEEK